MKLLNLLLMLLASLYVQSSFAFTCRDTAGNVLNPSGGDATITVQVGPTLIEGKNQLADLSSQISCHNDVSADPNWTDYLYTVEGGLAMYPALSDVVGGVTISGADYDNPIPRVLVYTIPSGGTKSLPLKVYINLHDYPSNPVVIHKGDMLAKITFNQRNNYGINDNKRYAWTFISANDAGILTSSCTINNGQVLDVPFGRIRSDFITLDPLEASIKIDKDLTYHCDRPVTQNITIKLYSDVSGFSGDAIKTTNKDVGVIMMKDGAVVAPGTSFRATLNNGQGQDIVRFVPVKDPKVDSLDIAAGPFTGSATLVMSVD